MNNDESPTLLHTQKKGTALALRMGESFTCQASHPCFGNISDEKSDPSFYACESLGFARGSTKFDGQRIDLIYNSTCVIPHRAKCGLGM